MLAQGARRTRLIRSFPDTIDALLVTRLVNLRYLTGFTGSNGALLVGRDGSALVATDGRYLTQVAAEAPDLECHEARSVAVALVERADGQGVRRLGVEAGHVTLALHGALQQAAGDRLQLVPVEPLVEPIRAVKDAGEIAALERACSITDAAFARVTAQLRSGVSERDVAWWLESAMREHGAAGPSFDSIVAFGPHSAIPHHQPTDRLLSPGDLAKFDFGALYDGYHADMTRTVVLSPAADWQRELHALVSDVQSACLAAVVVGAVPSELDALASRAIMASGHRVAHGLGHGVGLEIHEDPFLTAGSAARPLVESVALTVEPGIYLPGEGGVRIEDTVLTSAHGPVSMTTSTRELIEVGVA
jgi:Xaa-Pro aminopeptidase